jgi:hypothetical protein
VSPQSIYFSKFNSLTNEQKQIGERLMSSMCEFSFPFANMINTMPRVLVDRVNRSRRTFMSPDLLECLSVFFELLPNPHNVHIDEIGEITIKFKRALNARGNRIVSGGTNARQNNSGSSASIYGRLRAKGKKHTNRRKKNYTRSSCAEMDGDTDDSDGSDNESSNCLILSHQASHSDPVCGDVNMLDLASLDFGRLPELNPLFWQSVVVDPPYLHRISFWDKKFSVNRCALKCPDVRIIRCN